MSEVFVTRDRYHADDLDEGDTPHLSAGVINCLLTHSPRHAWYSHPKLNPDWAPTVDKKFDVGTAAHQVLLEGNANVANVAVVDAKDWKTNAAKAAWEEAHAAGLVPLLAHQWENVQLMTDAVRLRLALFDIEPTPFTEGRPEVPIVWNENGVACKALLDWWHADGTVSDLKTTSRSANPELWCKTTLWSIGADVQARFYQRGVKAITGVEPAFRFVVVETSPPYELTIVELAPAARELADAKIDRALEIWERCLATDTWPGYVNRVAFAEPPAWLESQWLESEAREVAA